MSDPKTVWLDALKVALGGLVDEADLAVLDENSAPKLATLAIRRLRAEVGGLGDRVTMALGPERAGAMIAAARGAGRAAAQQASEEEVADAVERHKAGG